MTDEAAPSSETPAAGGDAAAGLAGPSIQVLTQFIRDLSFENPGAPGSTLAGGANPQFSVSINVGVKKQSDGVYAVEITLNAKAEREKAVLFNVELVYGGMFRVRNVPDNVLPQLLMV